MPAYWFDSTVGAECLWASGTSSQFYFYSNYLGVNQLNFTFTQPVADHRPEQPAPAASVVSAVNYDRSPSLVAPEPNTPIPQCEFQSFAEAQAAYAAFLPGCNWPKPPTLKRFWYESEKHLTPNVDFVSWGFREHPLWVAANNGEIVERTEETEELAAVVGPTNFTDVGPIVAGRPEVAAAFERAKAIEDGVDLERGPQILNVETGETRPVQPGEGAIVDDITVSEPVKPITEEARSIVTDHLQSAAPVVATAPTVRLKYTPEEYADLRNQAEENHAIELQRKENAYAEISMERAKAEDKVKALKAEEKGMLESLRFFKSEGPKYPKNPEVVSQPASVGSAGSAGAVVNQEGSSSSPAAPATSPHDVDDERYQRYCALPLMPIVNDIKGLGSAKLDTLISSYPTVGKLLDLQKEKGLQWYKAVGKGFGPELGSRIEEAVTNALLEVE